MKIPGVTYTLEKTEKYGVPGSWMTVTVHGQTEEEGFSGEKVRHHHSTMDEIAQIISGLRAPDAVKKDTLAVYEILAEAESAAHGCPVSEIHFHEVGAMDAIADIAGVYLHFVDKYTELPLSGDSPAGIGLGKRTFSSPSYFAVYKNPRFYHPYRTHE